MIKSSKFKNGPPIHHAGNVYVLLMNQMLQQMHTSGLESTYKQHCLWYIQIWVRFYVHRIMIDWLHISYLALNLLSFDIPVGGDSSVDKTTPCTNGVDVPGIESRWEKNLSLSFQTGAGTYPAFCVMCTWYLLQGLKRPGRGVHYPSHLEPKLKIRAMRDCTSGFSWPVLRWNLPLPVW